MRNNGLWRLIVGTLAIIFVWIGAFGQQMRINTNEIESLIDEWNFANNTRNIHSFERVYADELTFYTQNLTRRRAIELKQQLFKQKPDFRQRIITEITYKPYTKGVVKADFTKEVFEKSRWKRYPSYLLISYEDSHYSIVGESDYPTDRVLKFKPDIGEPMTFEKSPAKPDTSAPMATDSATALTNVDTADALVTPAPTTPEQYRSDSSEVTTDADASAKAFKLDDLSMVFSNMTALGNVTIPKAYIYILIGMLALGGLVIFIADSLSPVRRSRRRPISKRHAEAEHVVRDFKMQSGFESFVTTLFDPLLFKIKRLKTEHVFAGQEAPAEKGPDFVLSYENKETQVRFAIKCQYYRNEAKNEVQLFTSERQRMFRQFEEDRDMDVYYVLGFGGQPDDPKELFFVPAKDVSGEFITKTSLRNYSKSGMFYYSRATGRIQ